LSFIYPIYNHNWRNISTIYIYIYITRLASNEIFSPSNKIHREVSRAKDLSATRYQHRADSKCSIHFKSLLVFFDLTKKCPKANAEIIHLVSECVRNSELLVLT